MTDDTIPTGDPTTVPMSELEELMEHWDTERERAAENGLDEYANGHSVCLAELQALINKHDPKQ